jgi:hypothetical protein
LRHHETPETPETRRVPGFHDLRSIPKRRKLFVKIVLWGKQKSFAAPHRRGIGVRHCSGGIYRFFNIHARYRGITGSASR